MSRQFNMLGKVKSYKHAHRAQHPYPHKKVYQEGRDS